ncbi:MAG: hypothetical protein NC816_04155 [Candidatus Omnitrophica bacterium]|nr:hypothetical protein [Candidatus Omnitrophota bacterium]MCM8833097.1 hypothetical protein [Candidatus Omnitrophota bacterium]
MITEINERIVAGVIFKNGSMKIKWFIWKNKKINIKKITYKWKTKTGEKNIYNFAVTDGINVFEISFSPEDLIWNLEKVHTF